MAQRLVLAAIAGVLAGVSSFVFLEVLDRVTETRLDHPRLVYVLPLAGLVLGLAAPRVGRVTEGNGLVMAEVRRPTSRLPWTMAPYAPIGAWVTHLFGGSAGREGIALQMSASLADQLPRWRPLPTEERRTVLVAALAGGFGAVFGVAFAGTVFALEVQSIGFRGRARALVPAAVAAFVGDAVVHRLGHTHPHRPAVEVSFDVRLALGCVVAGLAFGATGAVFVRAVLVVRLALARAVRWAPLRPAIGGAAVVALALLAGREYLGLSLPLLERGLAGEHLPFSVFALKLVLTAITIGAGFPGGEVTPLFVIGTTLGAALASPLDADVVLFAALGFGAVFAAAARTPLACVVLTVDLFGAAAFGPALVVGAATALSAAVVAPHGIYHDHDAAVVWVSGWRRAHRGGRAAVRRWRRRAA